MVTETNLSSAELVICIFCLYLLNSNSGGWIIPLTVLHSWIKWILTKDGLCYSSVTVWQNKPLPTCLSTFYVSLHKIDADIRDSRNELIIGWVIECVCYSVLCHICMKENLIKVYCKVLWYYIFQIVTALLLLLLLLISL